MICYQELLKYQCWYFPFINSFMTLLFYCWYYVSSFQLLGKLLIKGISNNCEIIWNKTRTNKFSYYLLAKANWRHDNDNDKCNNRGRFMRQRSLYIPNKLIIFFNFQIGWLDTAELLKEKAKTIPSPHLQTKRKRLDLKKREMFRNRQNLHALYASITRT